MTLFRGSKRWYYAPRTCHWERKTGNPPKRGYLGGEGGRGGSKITKLWGAQNTQIEDYKIPKKGGNHQIPKKGGRGGSKVTKLGGEGGILGILGV